MASLGKNKIKAAFGAQTDWESWECPALGWEGSGETLDPVPVPKAAPRERERDFEQACEVIGQGRMALNDRGKF